MTRYAIIVAGGSGSRFGSAIPKQFLPLAGTPVLMHTINRFAAAGATIILVLPQSQIKYWNQLCQQHSFTQPLKVVAGGDNRFGSVKNALAAIDASQGDLIAVHDGVRPLVPLHVIDNAYAQAASLGNAVPVVAVTDSIRQTGDDGTSCALDRSRLVAVQTPQTFDAMMLKRAYAADYDPTFTDDASVVERAGFAIHLVAGDPCNIKITHPGDIEVAETLLKSHRRHP